jgi:hypothetical protein
LSTDKEPWLSEQISHDVGLPGAEADAHQPQRAQGVLGKAALQIYMPTQIDSLAEKIRDWAKKTNKDKGMRRLQRTLTNAAGQGAAVAGDRRKTIPPREPFISVSSRSNMGAQIEVWFSHLPVNELDWDEATYPLAGLGTA